MFIKWTVGFWYLLPSPLTSETFDRFILNLVWASCRNSTEHSPCEANFAQLDKKFPAFYGTQMFITVFTKVHHWTLSGAKCIQSTTSYPISLRFILILSFHLFLGLPSGLFPPMFKDDLSNCRMFVIYELERNILCVVLRETRVWNRSNKEKSYQF
jgi:hypothetical protein